MRTGESHSRLTSRASSRDSNTFIPPNKVKGKLLDTLRLPTEMQFCSLMNRQLRAGLHAQRSQ